MSSFDLKRQEVAAFMFTYIHHVGIACRDLDAKIDFYRDTFGLVLVGQESSLKEGVREAMLQVGDNDQLAASPLGREATPSYVQLLEPLGPDSPVGKFLAKRGEGIHHIGYAVADITEAMKEINVAGIQLIDKLPRHGSMGSSIAFLHPRDVGGVLTELVQVVGLAHADGTR
jgi:methylmalonyl-CoA/ethylmalonyl-CoA epimerase